MNHLETGHAVGRNTNNSLDLDCGRIDLTTWSDPVIDQLGHDCRSTYAETFWLGQLGPSTLWLLRLAANRLENEPDGAVVPIDVAETAACLGLAWNGGRNSPFNRTIERAVRFGLARPTDPHTLAIRRRLPPLTQRQIARLPQRIRQLHASWVTAAANQNSETSSSKVRTPNPVPPFGHTSDASSVAAGPAISR